MTIGREHSLYMNVPNVRIAVFLTIFGHLDMNVDACWFWEGGGHFGDSSPCFILSGLIEWREYERVGVSYK